MTTEDPVNDGLLHRPELLISEREAAARLGMIPQTLERWRREGVLVLPYVLVNESIRYKPSDIEAYIKRQTRPAAEEK